jgi:hypothetical protein
MRKRITKSDRTQIEQAVAAVPNIDTNIVSVICDDLGRVIVRAGRRDGPRSGIERVLEATKADDGKWSVKLIGGWRSKTCIAGAHTLDECPWSPNC